MNQFAEQLRKMIKRSGKTMQAFAEDIGMDKGNLSRIVNGKECVTIDRAERIADALGATVSIKIKKNRTPTVV